MSRWAERPSCWISSRVILPCATPLLFDVTRLAHLLRVLHDWGDYSPDCDGMGPYQGAYGQEQQLFTGPQGQLLRIVRMAGAAKRALSAESPQR